MSANWLAIEPLLDGLTEQQQIELLRGTLAAHISDATLDSDILEAIRNPHGPLHAAGLCRVQVLHRNVRVPLREALFFSDSSLGRDRVEAMLWHESPFQHQPTPARPTPEMAFAV